MSEYKVPRLLWESLESVLNASGRAYVRELAKILKVPEKELVKKVFPKSDSIKVIMYDTTTETLQCQAFVSADCVTCKCRKPVVLGSEFCEVHQLHRMTVVESPDTVPVQKLSDNAQTGRLWIVNSTDVINSSGVVVGKWNECTNRLRMFVVKDD